MIKNGKRASKPDLPRKRVTVSIDESLLKWADEQLEEGFRYKDRSHIFEIALDELRQKHKKTK